MTPTQSYQYLANFVFYLIYLNRYINRVFFLNPTPFIGNFDFILIVAKEESDSCDWPQAAPGPSPTGDNFISLFMRFWMRTIKEKMGC